MPLFDRIAIISLGMLGGSIALAVRERGLAKEIVGVSRSRETVRLAEVKGIVDRGVVDPRIGVQDAELVVLASPVHAMGNILQQAAPGLRAGAIVTDVGSVKGVLEETLSPLLPDTVTYVGSHPMAGSHERGLCSARVNLLKGATCVVIPAQSNNLAEERVRAFWTGLGMRVVLRDPIAHDKEVAWVSHAPHAVAFAFAEALGVAPDGESELRGSGFRDFTRIARSDPELWADILMENRTATLEVLSVLSDRLLALSGCLKRGDFEALKRFIAIGRASLVDGDDNSSNS